MRIQRQCETFAYRIARELPPVDSVTPMPDNFPGTGQDWLERTVALENMLFRWVYVYQTGFFFYRIAT